MDVNPLLCFFLCCKIKLACAPKHIRTTQCGLEVRSTRRALYELCFGETNLDDESFFGHAKCDAVIIIYYLYRRSAKFEEEPRNIYNIL